MSPTLAIVRRAFSFIVGLCFLCVLMSGSLTAQDLRGHGGPVRALAITPNGETAITGSFDTAAILWDLQTGAAKTVLRKHEGPVNSAIALSNNLFATGGDDGRVIVWELGRREPLRILEGHEAPIPGLAASPDGMKFASASWDSTIRIWPAHDDAPPKVLKGHSGQVNAVAYLPDGVLVSGGYDATVRFWQNDKEINTITLPSPINRIVPDKDGFLAGCADGHIRFFNPGGQARGEIELGPSPVVALASSPVSGRAVAGTIDGRVFLIDLGSRKVAIEHQSRGWPVWVLAFTPDGSQFFSGGGDGLVRRWDATTGEAIGGTIADAKESIPAQLRETRGAEVFKACAACHTLSEDVQRAGPTLHGVMGRRIATAKNYIYSEALTKLNIVWSKDTIAKLFEIGPHAYTPGTKMPEQRLNENDRQALVDFLEKATR